MWFGMVPLCLLGRGDGRGALTDYYSPEAYCGLGPTCPTVSSFSGSLPQIRHG